MVHGPVTANGFAAVGVRWLGRAAARLMFAIFGGRDRKAPFDPVSDSLTWVVDLVFAFVCVSLVAAVLAVLGGTVLARAPNAIHDALFTWVIPLIMIFGFAGMAINGVRFEVLAYRRKARGGELYVSDRVAHRRVPFLLVPTDLDLLVQAIVAIGITVALAV